MGILHLVRRRSTEEGNRFGDDMHDFILGGILFWGLTWKRFGVWFVCDWYSWVYIKEDYCMYDFSFSYQTHPQKFLFSCSLHRNTTMVIGGIS